MPPAGEGVVLVARCHGDDVRALHGRYAAAGSRAGFLRGALRELTRQGRIEITENRRGRIRLPPPVPHRAACVAPSAS